MFLLALIALLLIFTTCFYFVLANIIIKNSTTKCIDITMLSIIYILAINIILSIYSMIYYTINKYNMNI
jgi:hypothetical protein